MVIKRYNEYIKERVGFADPTAAYIRIIFDHMKYMITDLYSKSPDEQKLSFVLSDLFLKKKMSSKEKELTIDFPVRKFFINFKFTKNDLELWNHSESTYGTSAMCYEFTKLNKEITPTSRKSGIFTDEDGNISIHARLDFSVTLSDHFVMNNETLKKIYIELESTISHELNHLYDSYSRISKNIDKTGELELSKDIDAFIGVVKLQNPNPEIISKDLFDEWIDFTYLIYYSEPHEINAVSQESRSYIKNGIPLDKISGWDIQRKLNEFNRENFIKKMTELAGGDESKLELLKSDFAERFRRLLVSQGKLINGVYNTKHNMDFMMKSSFRKFVNHFGRIITKAGKRLKRNILRMNSYEED